MAIFIDLTYDQAGGHGGVRAQTQMVVIHATDNTASDTAEAHYAEHRPDGTSAHFYSDEDSVTQALDTDLVAYGCYPTGNSRSVQFEIVGLSNRLTDAALRRVAPIVARVCKLYNLPMRKLSAADLVGGQRGICGHLDVTNAWQQGDHTDPGASFPWDRFIGYVQSGDDMTPEQAAALGRIDGALAGGHKPTAFNYEGGGALGDLLGKPAGAVTMSAADRQAIVADLGALLGGKLDLVLAHLKAAGQALDA